MTALEIFEQEHIAKMAAIEEEHKLTLAKAKAALSEAKLKKQFTDEMVEIEAQMAAMFPSRLSYAAAVITKNAHLVAAAGGGAEDENNESIAEHPLVMYKLLGYCNNHINGIECEFGTRCRYIHPEGEFKQNEYNFPKKLQEGDYHLTGFCVNTLNGRNCMNNRCRFTHPKGYQFGETPVGKKRELGVFLEKIPNWPTA